MLNPELSGLEFLLRTINVFIASRAKNAFAYWTSENALCLEAKSHKLGFNFGRKRRLIRITAKSVVNVMVEIHSARGPVFRNVFA